MPVALITGITGQDGSYLAELLLAKGYHVSGLVRRSPTTSFERIAHIQHDLQLVHGDLSDETSLLRAVRETSPDEVYNLGAHSVVSTSFSLPAHTGDVTGLGAVRLLEAVRQTSPEIRFFQASTSELFGPTSPPPQNVQTNFHPRSPYGVAKLYAHWMTVHYRERYDMFCSSGILFNHESPRRGLEFVTRKITHAAARISVGRQETLALGNLDSRRDWGFAGDYVDAMWRMLQADSPGDFVIGTGVAHSVADVCAVAFDHVGLDYREFIRSDPRFMRPVDPTQLVADPSAAESELGWTPSTSFENLITDMVDADLKRVDASG